MSSYYDDKDPENTKQSKDTSAKTPAIDKIKFLMGVVVTLLVIYLILR